VARAVHRTWYRIALARPGDESLLVAAEGEHLGAAIAAAEQHVKGAYACAVERAADDAIPLGESVGKQGVVALPDEVSVPAFRWPRGVLPQLGHVADVRKGFKVHADKLLVVEAQTDREHVQDLFLGVLERLPSADNLEVRVLDHFEGATATEVWLTSRLDGRKILELLDDLDVELIENGHVELSVYIRKAKATLRLTEHKTVVWLSEGEELRADVLSWFTDLGVTQIDPLVTITSVPHVHYRPAKSRERNKLLEHLYRQRLRRVDKLAARAPETDG
jgi:hypothetical protein